MNGAPGIDITALPSGRLRIEAAAFKLKFETVPICFTRSGVAILTVAVAPGRAMARLAGIDILDSSAGTRVIRLAKPPATREGEALAAGEKSRGSHRRTLRQRLSSTAAVSDRRNVLREELDQLRELLIRLEEGAAYHAPGVAVILRKLLVRGAGNQLIRDVAALSRLPLLVYVGPKGHQDVESVLLNGAEHHLNTAFSAIPTGGCQRETDIEEWLSSTAYQGVAGQFTHHDLVEVISNKLGAHRDYEQGKVVTFLKSLKIGEASALLDYLANVGELALKLGERLLAT